MESFLLLSDAVFLLRELVLLENENGFSSRIMEVVDDRRGYLCLAVLMC